MPDTPDPSDTPEQPDAPPPGEPPTLPSMPPPTAADAGAGWWADPSAAPGDGPGDDAAGATGSSSSPRRVGTIVAAAVVALGLVGGGVAYAATRGDGGDPVAAQGATGGGAGDQVGQAGGVRSMGMGPGTSGEITALDGTTLTIEADDGSATTVTTDDDTIVTETVEGTTADIEVGDNVVVIGSDGDETALTAARITDSGDTVLSQLDGGFGGAPDMSQMPDGADAPAPPDGFTPPDGADAMTPPEGDTSPDGADGAPEMPEGMGPAVRGEVTAVDGDTFTVTKRGGEEAVVTMTDDTEVSVTTVIEVGDLEVGDTVVVQGEVGDDAVAADAIRRGDELELVGGGGPMGGGGMPGGPGGAGGADEARSGDGATTTTEA